jgi:hypothetical protein
MQARYSLRFENGERRGETIPISGSVFTVGRRPGNSAQLSDASVSGRHAEFVVESDGVLVRDLGSTNGTKVDGERIESRKLVHGDEVLLGSVKVTLLEVDRAAPGAPAGELGGGDELELEYDEPTKPSAAAVPAARTSSAPAREVPRSEPIEPPVAAPIPAQPAPTADAVRTISADKVARSGKRSMLGVALLAVAALGGGAAWFFLQPKGGEEVRSARAVEPVSGNLLEQGYSFEGDGAAWEADVAGPEAFDVERGARYSGESGLSAFVDGDKWALARSAAVKGSGTRVLTLRGMARVRDAARARVGLELLCSSGASATTLALGPALAAGGEFESFEFVATVPPSFDSVRAVLFAESSAASGGSIAFDDVALVPGGEAQASSVDEFQLVQHGPGAATLFKIDRSLFSDFHVRSDSGGIGVRGAISVAKDDAGFTLALAGEGRRTLSLRIDEPLYKGGLATTGSGGYRTHATEFTREGVSSVIAGSDRNQIRLAFETPLTLRGRTDSGGMRLELDLGAATKLRLQTSFLAERDEAQKLLRAAREAEKAGELGLAAATWLRLRDEVPFDAKALEEADAARTRIAEAGLAELRRLRGEVERARFFRLPELYRQCRRDALATATRYKGSEIENYARLVSVEIDRDFAALEADLARAERRRLEGIAGALDASASPKLAARVRDYLQGMAGATAPREEKK